MVLATTRLDVNGVVRQLLEARKASSASMDDAVALRAWSTAGSRGRDPDDWALLVDSRIPAIEGS